ncbi:MAG: SDR family oxidoreductase [Streptosporangiaceae bacterium]
MSIIGVTGATGAVGGKVAERLAARGIGQRLIVRDVERAPRLAGAEIIQGGSYGDVEVMREAFRGVDVLFLVSAKESLDRVPQHLSAVDAAVRAGVRHVVYLSFLAAAPDATFTYARDHFATEQFIREKNAEQKREQKLAFTFVRPSLYLDHVPHLVNDGAIRGPAGNGRVAWVAQDDLADVVAGVLAAPVPHIGRTYNVTGPEALTMAETAALLGAEYVEETLAEARESRAGYAVAEWEIQGWISSYAAIATGEMNIVGDAVPRATGHPATSLKEFLSGR